MIIYSAGLSWSGLSFPFCSAVLTLLTQTVMGKCFEHFTHSQSRSVAFSGGVAIRLAVDQQTCHPCLMCLTGRVCVQTPRWAFLRRSPGWSGMRTHRLRVNSICAYSATSRRQEHAPSPTQLRGSRTERWMPLFDNVSTDLNEILHALIEWSLTIHSNHLGRAPAVRSSSSAVELRHVLLYCLMTLW